jgi:hypothetical protein
MAWAENRALSMNIYGNTGCGVFIWKYLPKNQHTQRKLLNFENWCTGKYLSEALMFASINPQYDNRLFMELPWKIHAQNMSKTCSVHVLPMFCACSFHGNSMNNLLSYCGLIDGKISASEKDIPVIGRIKLLSVTWNFKMLNNLPTF